MYFVALATDYDGSIVEHGYCRRSDAGSAL
jgi:hypothetical protein